MSMTFTDTNEQILEWILLTISKTIKHCSETEEELFRFLPEYYIDNMVGLIVLLPDYANKTQQYENIITGDHTHYKYCVVPINYTGILNLKK